MASLSAAELEERLRRFPHFALATLPTPLQPLRLLSKELGGPEIWVKRDDLTGLAFGGNKIRQLEYFVGAALADGADVLIGGGGYAQSNHARACSAAARAAGLEPVVVVRPAGPEPSPSDVDRGGNALLTKLLCDDVRVEEQLSLAPTERLAEVAARREVFARVAEEYRGRGHRPYTIPGTSTALGVMGYLAASIELQLQFEAVGVSPDWVVCTSMGVTQAGLELGSRLLGVNWRVCGMAYRPMMSAAPLIISRLLEEAAALVGVDFSVPPEEVLNLEAEAGPAYGVPSNKSKEALKLTARTEGLLLDPVYTAKGMAGLISAIRTGFFSSKEVLVFVHTGGQPALFADDC